MLCESCTCLSFVEPEWSSLCCRQFVPVKCNTVWGTIISSSKIKTCHVQYWRKNGNAWRGRLSIEIYIVRRANVHSTYWQQTCNIFYWSSLSSSLCVLRYLSICTGRYFIYRSKSGTGKICGVCEHSHLTVVKDSAWYLCLAWHKLQITSLNLRLKWNLFGLFLFFFFPL